ncbi:MAG: hypothetical protein JWR19_1119 [Pedosphaera sp.]|nr:hypothetical protein [Pedosphaera sp.]
MAGVTTVRGQSALDGFDPNANSTVRVVVVQPDGKILLGGDFTLLSPNGGAPVTRNNIARLNPDGTLDTAFNPNANGAVYAIAVQADGKILAGGGFTTMGGVTRQHIARLDPTTGAADSFNPIADSDVHAIAVQADGKILVGGVFGNIGVLTRNDIARLDPASGVADSFDPNANGEVRSIVVQADGKVLVGGLFTALGGATRNFIARLDAAGGLADSWNPNANNTVTAIALQADGKILAVGSFNGANSIGGQTRNRIARLDPTTGAADTFDPNANALINAIAVQANGKILVGGAFPNVGGAARNFIARLDPTTGAADSFDPNANSAVLSIAVQADGKILVGGSFTSLSPDGGATVTRNSIARLETDGRLDQTRNLSIVGGWVTATAVQPDGKILIGGRFSSVLGVARNDIARLNTDGTLDMAFNPSADVDVYSLAVQADGRILVGGAFGFIGAVPRNRIARLDPTTGAADSFDPNANSYVYAIAVQADGKIVVGGAFTTLSPNGGAAVPRNRIARLDATTGAVDSFDPNANDTVNAITVQADGKILAGGGFTTLSANGGAAVPRNRMARLDATTGAADSFNPNANIDVTAIAVQADGKILAGGGFTTIGGATRHYIARLDATTGVADSFDPNASDPVVTVVVQADGKILAGGLFNGANSIGGATRNRIARLDPTSGLADSWDPNANNQVQSIAVQADGKILAGGNFTSIGGQTRNYFARLSNDTAALQNLDATQSTVTWTRGGSSVQFTRMTFESSTDNVTYTPLGNGTEAGSNWTLTGLNLPTGQNIYIRARGYYRSGNQNGSESITESVRNAFLILPASQPRLNIQRDADTNVVLSWPTDFTGFTLESNTNLNTNTWSVVPTAPAISGTNNVVTNTVSSPARFYRLRK